MSQHAAIGVLGAGAFGTALAIALAASGDRVALWGRDPDQMARLQRDRCNAAHLPGVRFPDSLLAGADPAPALAAPVVLLAVPTQALRGVLQSLPAGPAGQMLVLCCKGIERGTGHLPGRVAADVRPAARIAVLTGPSFAAELAAGLPTAVTLATTDPGGVALQERLATPALRPYLSDDPVGAQLGGALKNVIAIAAGIADGAGLGESARAALITRGFAEIVRHAETLGARRETLFGLSGLGDLVLTCTSGQSRNYRHGRDIGAGRPAAQGVTVEGVATATALSDLLPHADLPVTHCVAAVVTGRLGVAGAVDRLMSRPLKREG
jgi:glycerol-3-phosphate dehydrogenase (NAD(P)+)